AQQILAAVCRRYIVPIVPAMAVVYWDVKGGIPPFWDVNGGIPLTPDTWARWLYILISLGTSYVFMFTLWFVWEAHDLAQQLAAAYPLGDNLWHAYHTVRTLITPFIELAFLTALVFAGVVISRSRFFDHWEWSLLHYLFFTVIASLLLYLTFDDHR